MQGKNKCIGRECGLCCLLWFEGQKGYEESEAKLKSEKDALSVLFVVLDNGQKRLEEVLLEHGNEMVDLRKCIECRKKRERNVLCQRKNIVFVKKNGIEDMRKSMFDVWDEGQ